MLKRRLTATLVVCLCLVLGVGGVAALTIAPPIGNITINGHTYTNADWEANAQGTLVAVINDFVAVLTTPSPVLGHTPTLASLKALSVSGLTADSRIYRDSYSAQGDGGAQMYRFQTSDCADADDIEQIQPDAGTGCWRAEFVQYALDIRIAGAKCDGSTDDSAAIAGMATAAGRLKGRSVYIPSTGHACLINTGITLPANVALDGVPGHHWSGTTFFDPDDWAAAGSWMQCADETNPCFTLDSVGNYVRNINVIYAQPEPTTGSWTPTTFPYTFAINDSANFWGFENVSITAATHCIDIEGQTSGIAGINGYINNLYFNGCFDVGIKFNRVDNEIRMSNVYNMPWWYADNALVLTYIQAHKVDWLVTYLANIQANNIVFGRSYRAIQLQNGSVTSGFGTVTFAGNDWQLSNISFNLVCQAVSMPDGNGTVSSGVKMTNVVAYTDFTTSCAHGKTMFDLPSDNADWTLSHLRGGYMDTLASIGAGTAGTLKLIDVDVAEYSHYTAAQPALKVSANASLSWYGAPLDGLRGAVGAGPKVGPGVSGQGYMADYVIGTGGGIEGSVAMQGSHATGFTGNVAFYLPDGTRTGYIGRASTLGETNIVSDIGDVDLTPASGKLVNMLGATKLWQKTVATLPACDASLDGASLMVSDLLTPTYGAAPTGGGALRGHVTCTDGTGWRLQ